MSKAFDFIKECGSFWVSSINGPNPALRPFGAIMEYNGCLYISTGIAKDVYTQLIEEPNIQIAALKAGTREWIRISGKAIEATAFEEKVAMFKACPILAKRFSSPDDTAFVLFRIENATALLCNDQGKIPFED